MKKLVSLLTVLLSANTQASGGFTWLGGIAHSLHIPSYTVTFLVVGLLLVLAGLLYRKAAAAMGQNRAQCIHRRYLSADYPALLCGRRFGSRP